MQSAGRVLVAVPAMPWPAKMNGFRAPVRNPGSSAASARTKNLNLWISMQCMTTCPASMSQGYTFCCRTVTCYLLAVDFDKEDWRADVRALAQACRDEGVPYLVEISRSGAGTHLSISFGRRSGLRPREL